MSTVQQLRPSIHNLIETFKDSKEYHVTGEGWAILGKPRLLHAAAHYLDQMQRENLGLSAQVIDLKDTVAHSLQLTKEQWNKLDDVLSLTQDEGPAGSGWSSVQLVELRELVHKHIRTFENTESTPTELTFRTQSYNEDLLSREQDPSYLQGVHRTQASRSPHGPTLPTVGRVSSGDAVATHNSGTKLAGRADSGTSPDQVV